MISSTKGGDVGSLQEANRMKRLPLYLFTIMDELKMKAAAQGKNVIDLGMGSPDMPSPKHAVEELCRQAHVVENQRYSRPAGEVERKFKEAIAQWYFNRFGVTLDPEKEVLPLIGSKEGIAHIALAFLNNDDIGLVPAPSYPVHSDGIIMAGGILYNVPLTAENGFRPNFKNVPRDVLQRTKILYVSYPHNPTTACVDIDFYNDLAAWAKGKEIIVCSDLAYSDIVFDGYKAPSMMQAKGVKDIYGVEFHTFSKSYNMAGWRLGFVVGHPDILRSLAKTKSYIDFGIFRAVQWAAIQALLGPQDCVRDTVEEYRKRRNLFVDGLNCIGWKVEKPKATFYLWCRIPAKFSALTSLEFASRLVEEAGVVVAPGTGFGEYGEGFVRFALVQPQDRLKLAVERIGKVLAIA
ncbi:MAG: aminotransferase class I/II-fold pyridoxal phosphate-dependent enzyme [Candidatus Omnitrophica bacterium]|nr:aminotransferase class I/II-fold pyridoxal phosphate-dependent enzyme [Candidatus Omnitrophota bacterium]